MIPPMRLAPQPWMQRTEAKKLIAAFTDAGYTARYVGGCVRDAVLGLPIRDIDIATDALPERSMALIRGLGMTAEPTGIDHGTVTAVGKRSYEITTLRRDVATDGRHATVAFTDDWREDAARRDFTMNALFLDADGTVLDFFGGLADLAAGHVRFVGDPARRLAEDTLRLLRFFRFHAFYGRGAPDAEGLAACRQAAPRLPALSVERIRQEILRLLEAPEPVACLRLMQEAGILRHALPEAGPAPLLDRLAHMVALDQASDRRPDALLRLLALLPPGGQAASALALRWKLSNAERDRMEKAAALAPTLSPDLSSHAAHIVIQAAGNQALADAAGLRACDGNPAQWDRLRRLAWEWQAPEFPVKGRDLAALGLQPGPEMGRLLKLAEAWWIEGDFTADRSACLDHLKALISQA